MSSSSPGPNDDNPDHAGLVPVEIHDLIQRAHWQSAKSVEDVAPHQYVVIGWNKDDLTDDEFWFFVRTVEKLGRLEEWTPPKGVYDSGNRRPVRNRYLYVGEYAYWFTRPRVPMLNREHVSVQQVTQSRHVVKH